MKVLIRGAAVAVAWALVGSIDVQAQLTPAPPDCDYMMAMSAMDPDATDCSGAWAGNDMNQQADVLAEIEGQGWLTGAYFINSVDTDGWGTTGTINLGGYIEDFVLALKAGDTFSLYYFAGGATSVDYVTYGAGATCKEGEDCGPINGLSHWSLYGGRTTSVPEPGSLLLLGTGLLGLGLTRRKVRVVA